jgi:hypothetical protein
LGDILNIPIENPKNLEDESLSKKKNDATISGKMMENMQPMPMGMNE